ncbi:MAG: hypothetical protein IH806_00655, partial [Proteobacteria bacterium]|nr:hypothetical protein [Pseudomonadota bacterium]
RGKGVTISKSAKSKSGRRGRHPRAVAIFASNNRGGLFAKGVNVKNAFKKKDGALGSSTHGGQVSAVARDLVTYGGADVSAKAKDGGLSSSGSGGGGLSSSGSGGGGLSSSGSGGGGLSSSGSGGGGGLSSNSGSGGGGLSSGGSGGGLGASNAGGLGSGSAGGPPANIPGKGKAKGGGKKS